MDASPLRELAEQLVAVFESQIAGGNLRWWNPVFITSFPKSN